MFKKFMLISLGLLLPIILLFTVYRASVGLGPLNIAAIGTLLGDSFSNTKNQLSLIFDQLNLALDGLSHFSALDVVGYKQGNIIDRLFFVVDSLASSVFSFFTWISLLIHRLFVLFLLFFEDISEIIRILGVFIISGSPYPVEPYFPVG